MNGAWRRTLAVALTVGVAAALRAQTYNLSDYFPLEHDSEWYLVDAGPMPEGDTDAFRWEVLPDELALPGGLFARKMQTTTDEESDDRNHDIDYWRHNPNGNVEMWGSYVNDFPTGPYNLVLGAPLIAGTNGMTVGTLIESTQPYSFGFGIQLTVALNTTLVEALPSVETPLGTFTDVIKLRMGFEIRNVPLAGTYSVFDNYVYLARGVGVVWQTQRADTDDATDQKLASGTVAGVPITPTGPTGSTVGGTVTDGTNPLPGVTVSLGDGLQATSGADGTYSIAEVPAGDYTATPTLAGYTFDPASHSVTVPPDAGGVDFVGTAAPVEGEIVGWVLQGGAGVGGIAVTVAGYARMTTSPVTGYFAATGVPAGEYRIFPEPTPGYVFLPPQRVLQVPSEAARSVLFEAVPAGDGTVVPGSSAIVLAGRTDVEIPDLGVIPLPAGFPLGRNYAGGPVQGYVKEVFPAQFAVSPGETLTFAAGGGVDYYGGTEPTVGPDGDPDYPAAVWSLDGISGYSGPAGALVGVFLDDANPQGGTPPATLDFSAAGLGTAFASLAPGLGQVFFIGDGSTGSRPVQTFTAPAGATRLFLGIADAFGFGGDPGAYDDNIGAFVVTVTRLPAPSTYTVTFAHTPGGTLDGDPEQTVAAGADGDPVQANPAGGQHFVHWLDGLGAVYSTANPLTVRAVAANLALTAVFAANTPEDPQGEFDLRFASPANPDGRRLWDVSGGPYVFVVGAYGVSITLVQDLRGVLEGTGELTGDLHGTLVTVPLRVRGRVRGTGGTVVARLRFAGAAQNVVARGNAVLTVNAPNLVGPVTVSVTSRALGDDTATESCTVALPAEMDGLYDLTVTLGLAGGRITGSGMLTLSNDRPVPLTIRGRAGTSGSSVRLTGNSRLEPAATAVSLGGIIATYTDGTGTIQSLQGQGFGQRIHWP